MLAFFDLSEVSDLPDDNIADLVNRNIEPPQGYQRHAYTAKYG
jgi:hypothetical protein